MPGGEGYAPLSGGDAMTNSHLRKIAASVHRCLLNKSKESARPFNELFFNGMKVMSLPKTDDLC
jgi:hypothetical protein